MTEQSVREAMRCKRRQTIEDLRDRLEQSSNASEQSSIRAQLNFWINYRP